MKSNYQTIALQASKWSIIALLIWATQVHAQYPPSHDPSRMIQNTDGRYWIFTTGQGIWAMSASTTSFSDWQADDTPFPTDSWPSWIANYVSGFAGFFWAPDVIKVGSTYFLYYSCAGTGAPAAIGLATATNLSGPWTDQGMVVAGNNAIDPSLLLDNGRLWMTWGNWQSGIDVIELSTSTGKPISSSTHLVDGQVEGPALLKNGSYYYLFYQRGLCCNGVNSTYYVVVARSTSVTGPYTGERTILPNTDGNIIGPGHIGYGEGHLTYHFYDGNDSGNAKLMNRTDFGYTNGWPYVGSTSGAVISGGTYRLTPRHSGTAIDVENCGTTDGTNVRQWSWLDNDCQKWIITNAGDGTWRLSPASAPLEALDVTNCSTANSANLELWSWLDNDCQKWNFISRGSGYYSIQSVASGKCLDVSGASTADGANLVQYTCSSTSYNQQFSFGSISGGRLATVDPVETSDTQLVSIYPNPVTTTLTIQVSTEGATSLQLLDESGRVVKSTTFSGTSFDLSVSDLRAGIYILEYENEAGTTSRTILKK